MPGELYQSLTGTLRDRDDNPPFRRGQKQGAPAPCTPGSCCPQSIRHRCRLQQRCDHGLSNAACYAAIDPDVLPGDVGRAFASKERNGRSDFFAGAVALERHAVAALVGARQAVDPPR